MPTSPGFCCPVCGGNVSKRQEFPSLTTVFWILNPALAFNELLLGQRLPRVTHSCIRCDQPLALRQYVHCPACHRFHHGMLWGKGNALGHWFGLFCPDCGSRIPVLLSLVSLLIIIVTAPLWWPLWRVIRNRWIDFERSRAHRQRAVRVDTRLPIRRWLRWGALGWGLPVWAAMGVFEVLRRGIDRVTVIQLVATLPLWLAGGALFGHLMKRILVREHKFKAGHCRACGYNLRGLPSNVCPECGFRFDPADRRDSQRDLDRG
ncbi:MAG: hypothetical protein GY842_04485 [bacterium]|nr:hypothetical protein [bacterium]